MCADAHGRGLTCAWTASFMRLMLLADAMEFISESSPAAKSLVVAAKISEAAPAGNKSITAARVLVSVGCHAEEGRETCL